MLITPQGQPLCVNLLFRFSSRLDCLKHSILTFLSFFSFFLNVFPRLFYTSIKTFKSKMTVHGQDKLDLLASKIWLFETIKSLGVFWHKSAPTRKIPLSDRPAVTKNQRSESQHVPRGVHRHPCGLSWAGEQHKDPPRTKDHIWSGNVLRHKVLLLSFCLFVWEWRGLKLLFLIWQWKYHFILLMPRASLSSAETSLPKTRLKTPAQASGSFLTASSVISLLCAAQVCEYVCTSFLYQIHMWQSPHAVSMEAWRVELFNLSVLWEGFSLFLSVNDSGQSSHTKPRECWSFFK